MIPSNIPTPEDMIGRSFQICDGRAWWPHEDQCQEFRDMLQHMRVFDLNRLWKTLCRISPKTIGDLHSWDWRWEFEQDEFGLCPESNQRWTQSRCLYQLVKLLVAEAIEERFDACSPEWGWVYDPENDELSNRVL